MVKYKVLELFSGIGGMHAAVDLLQRSTNDEFEIVAAIDINTTANMIYRFNHPKTSHWQRNITGITAKEINKKLSPDILLMSPPCQPHTRQGKRQDKQGSKLLIGSILVASPIALKERLEEWGKENSLKQPQTFLNSTTKKQLHFKDI